MKIKKYIKDGKVAVLYHSTYGSGWYSMDQNEQMLFSPEIVEFILNNNIENNFSKLYNLAEKLFPDAYVGFVDRLKIEWVPKGTLFRIDSYDGREEVIINYTQHEWIQA